MKKLVECGCENPCVCPDCKGTGYVRPGKVLASDLAIAAKRDDAPEVPGVNNLAPANLQARKAFMM